MVQLFNVVDKQQKDIQAQLEEVGSSERKRSKGIIIIIIVILCYHFNDSAFFN